MKRNEEIFKFTGEEAGPAELMIELGWLRSAGLLQLLSSISIMLLAWLFSYTEKNAQLLVYLCYASILISVYGLCSWRAAVKEASQPLPNNETSKRMLMVYFLLSLPLGLILMVIGILGLANIQKNKILLSVQSENQKDWEIYGTASFAEVYSQQFFSALLFNGLSLLTAVFFFISAYHSYEYTSMVDSQLQITYAELLAVTQGLLACLVGCAYYHSGESLTNLPGLAPVPPFLFSFSVVLAGILLVLAFSKFVTIYYELREGVTVTVFLTAIVGLMLLVFTIILALYLPYSKQELNKGCANILPRLNDDYVRSMGCFAKYNTTGTEYTSLACNKSEIKFVWEENYKAHLPDEKELYGCINMKCCYTIIEDIRAVFAIGVFFSLTLSIFSVISARVAWLFREQLKETGRRFCSLSDLFTGGHIGLFLLLCCGTALIATYYKQCIFKAPLHPTFLDTKAVSNKLAAKLGQFEFPQSNLVGGRFNFTPVSIIENRTNCGNLCDDFVYHTKIAVDPKYGKLFLSPQAKTFNKAIIEQESLNEEGVQEIKFRCYFADLNSIISLAQFGPNNPFRESNVALLVKAKHDVDYRDEIARKNNRRLLDNVLYQGEDPLYHVLARNFSFQIFNTQHKATYKGTVLALGPNSTFIPIPSAILTVSLYDSDKSVVYDGKTRTDGSYSMTFPLYVTVENLRAIHTPYPARVRIFKEGYLIAHTSFTVGMLELSNEVTLEPIVMTPNPHPLTALSINGTVFDAISEFVLRKAFVKVLDEKKVKDVTGYEGEFELSSPKTCKTAEIKVKKEGYYSYQKEVPCYSNLMIPLIPNIAGYKIRTVLRWKNRPADLDLHARFYKNSRIECKVDFTQSKCGGAVFLEDKKAGEDGKSIEIIDLNEVGNYQYIYYVDAYEQNGNETISQSEATVEIFSGDWPSPLAVLDVPSHNVQERGADFAPMKYWTVFCFNGSAGVNSIRIVNKLTNEKPQGTHCQEFYGSLPL